MNVYAGGYRLSSVPVSWSNVGVNSRSNNNESVQGDKSVVTDLI